MSSLMNALYGLTDRVLFNPIQNYAIKGTLIDEGNKLPVADFNAKIYARNYFGFHHLVGMARTDSRGSFSFNYDWRPSRFSSNHYITIELIGKRKLYEPQGLIGPVIEYPLLRVQTVFNNSSQNDLGSKNIALDTMSLDLSKVNKPLPNDYPNRDYFKRLVSATLPQAISSFIVKVFSHFLTTSQVQTIYNTFAKQQPKHEPTLNNLLNELKNKICAVDYTPMDNGDTAWIANWDGLTFDIPKSLPNIVVVAGKILGSKTSIKSISIQFREDSEPRIINLLDPENVKWAVYVVRSTFALKGEIDIHLGEGHLLPGLMARVFNKTIQVDNPLYDAVARYLLNLNFINDFGSKGIIFGTKSVLSSSALTEEDAILCLNARIKEKSNFKVKRPQLPIDEDHERARVACFHFNLLLDYYRDFIQKNAKGLEEHFAEIYSWSEGMNKLNIGIPQIIPIEGQFGDGEKENLALCLATLVNQTTYLHWSAHTGQDMLTHIDSATLSLRDFGLQKDGTLAPFGNTNPNDASLQLKNAYTLMNFESLRFKDYAHPDLLARMEEHKDRYSDHIREELFVSVEI